MLSLAKLNFIKVQSSLRYPNEACGVLFGNGKKIKTIIALKNMADNPEKEYLIAENYGKLAKYLEQEVIGFWHSHTNSDSKSSQTDKTNFLEYYIYIIYSVKHGSFSYYRNNKEIGESK